jgi:hypothetical protein
MVCQEKKINKKTIKGYGSAANTEPARVISPKPNLPSVREVINIF